MTPTPTEPLAAEPGRAAEARADIRTKRGQLGGGVLRRVREASGSARMAVPPEARASIVWVGERSEMRPKTGSTSGRGDQRPLTNMARELLPCVWGAIGGTKKQTPYTWTSDRK